MRRLSAATLAELPEDVARPRYDRGALATGIVHLGVGAFQRAHQATYTEGALNAGDLRWGIVGASLRSPAVRDQLAPQDWLYALAVRGAEVDDAGGERAAVVARARHVFRQLSERRGGQSQHHFASTTLGNHSDSAGM